MRDKRSRTFALELYPEDNSHMEILEYIKQHYEYAFILHDKDIWDKDNVDDETGELKNKAGEPKKEHYHVILNFKNPRSQQKLQEELGLKHIETCNFYAYTRYLIHKDDIKKYQYPATDIQTNIQLRVENALKREYNSQEQEMRILIDFIKSKQNFLTFMELVEYAQENDLLLEIRRNTYFYKCLCDDIGFRRY